jgi:catechol-2,3-dioxygenase
VSIRLIAKELYQLQQEVERGDPSRQETPLATCFRTEFRGKEVFLKARNIDHICIAVHDLGKARKVYEETLGLELALEYVAESEKIHVARYYMLKAVDHPPI